MTETIQPRNTHQLIERAQSKRGWITQVVWSPNGKALAVSGATGVALYGVEDGQLTLRGVLEGHSGHVKGVAVHPNGTYIATASSDTTIRLWHLNEGGRFDELRGHSDAINSVAFSPDGTLLVSGGGDGRVIFWDVASQQQKAHYKGPANEITCVRFTQDATHILAGGWDNSLWLWNIATGDGQRLTQQNDWIREIGISSRPEIIATASKDGTIRLWDINTGQRKGHIMAHFGGTDSISFNPDFSLLASGGRDNLIKFWDLTSGKQIGMLIGHEKPVMSVSFSPDGTWLASGSGDNTVRLWGVAHAE